MYLEGKNVALETILSGHPVKRVIMRESFKDDIIDVLKTKNISFEFLKDFEFERRFPKAQGIVIEIDTFVYSSFEECIKTVTNDSLVLILDGIEDPQNFGNMIRTFEALGGTFIIIPKNRACQLNETVAKVSVGAFNYVKICQVVNINSAIDILKDNGYWIVGTDMKGETLYDKISVDMPIGLVIGSEGFGMSHLTKQKCDYLVRIPMVGKINSLNASISAAIVLSSIISRRG